MLPKPFCGSISNKTLFCLGKKQGMLVNDECSSYFNRGGDFQHQFGTGDNSYCTSTNLHAWPNKTTPLQSVQSMALSDMPVECVIYLFSVALLGLLLSNAFLGGCQEGNPISNVRNLACLKGRHERAACSSNLYLNNGELGHLAVAYLLKSSLIKLHVYAYMRVHTGIHTHLPYTCIH